MYTLLAFLALALGVSFLCSVLEAVLLSITPVYVKQLEQAGHPKAAKLIRLRGALERPLAAILTLNTISHTVGAAGVGAQAQRLWGEASLAYTSAALTLLLLLFSEIVPKSLGSAHWRSLAPLTADVCTLLVRMLYPFVWLSEAFAKLFKSPTPHTHSSSREELAAMVQLGGERGAMDPQELRLFDRLLQLRELRTRDLMTPRPVVLTREASLSVAEAIRSTEFLRFSRIPLWQDEAENITGYVLKHDVLLAAARDELNLPLSSFVRPLVVVPESSPLLSLLETMVPRKEQIAMVVDEYGGFEGIATTEDLVEAMLGLQISDEADPHRPLRDIARERWQARISAIRERSSEEAAGA